MLVFKTKWFARWARGQSLSDGSICAAIREVERGLVDAVLGGQLIKKRIALPGRGKSGSVRAIVAYKSRDRAFCLYGFAKNEKDNIDNTELEALKKLSRQLFNLGETQLVQALQEGALVEVKCHEQDT